MLSNVSRLRYFASINPNFLGGRPPNPLPFTKGGATHSLNPPSRRIITFGRATPLDTYLDYNACITLNPSFISLIYFYIPPKSM
jgi:hypothetical protein